MPTFSSVRSCEIEPNGDLKFRLDDTDGKFRELSFQLSFVPTMIVLLNQHFIESTNIHETKAVNEFIGAHVPQSLQLATLLDGSQAIEVTTVSGMRIPLLVSPELVQALSVVLADLRPILQAEAEQAQSGKPH